MPVHVHVPIRVRLAAADLADLDTLAGSVEAAVGRALGRARQAVMEPRGAYVRPVLVAPAFSWTGRAGDVGAPGRATVEETIARAILDASWTSRLRDPVNPADAEEVLPPRPREGFDRTRWDRRARAYEIPTYGKGGKGKKKTTKAKLDSDQTKQVRTGRQNRFVRESDPDAMTKLYYAAYKRFNNTLPLRFGALFEAADGKINIYLFEMQGGVAKKVAFFLGTAIPTRDDGVRENAHISTSGTYTFERWGEGEQGLYAFRERIATSYRDANGKEGTQRTRAKANDFEKAVAAHVEKYTKDFDRSKDVYYALKSGNFTYVIAIGKVTGPIVRREQSWPVVSVLEEREVPLESDAEGEAEAGGRGDQDKGAGPDGGGLGEYGDYEGGVEGGIGVVLSIEGYDKRQSLFPTIPGEKGYDVTYEQYEDEPPITELGAAGERIRKVIEIIARMLDIPTSIWAAGFSIVAARIIGERAQQVTRFSMIDQAEGFMLEESVIGARDAKGHFYFKPVPSAAMQYLQHLARVIPYIRLLSDLVVEHISRRMDYAAWGFHYLEKCWDNAVVSCKHIFVYGCQLSLLEFLRSTRINIQKRRGNPEYLKAFQVLIETMLADQTELVLLRNALDLHINGAGKDPYAGGYAKAADEARFLAFLTNREQELESHQDDLDAMLELTDPTDFVQRRGEAQKLAGAGDILMRGSKWAIRDSKGYEWTLEQLDRTLELKRQSIESIDPLATRITSYPEQIRPLVDDPSKTEAFVESILSAMWDKNLSITRDAEGDHVYAFNHAIFKSAKPGEGTAGHTWWNLQGVHQMADEALKPAFGGDRFYFVAVDSLLAQHEGARALLDDLILVGTIVLSVFCPPLGAAVGFVTGMVMGYLDYRHAKELEELHGAVFFPEKIVSKAEIEIMLFVAKLQMALSFLSLIPGGKGAAKGGQEAAKRALTEGAEEAAVAAGKRAAAKIFVGRAVSALRLILQEIKGNLAGALAAEVIEEGIEDLIVGKIMEKVIDARIAELRAEARAAGTQ